VGGRFLSWGRVAVRMSDYDFKGASHDGIGEDWPICYNDLVPYYDRVEEFLGILGTADGIANLPDGMYVASAGLNRLEQAFKQKVESVWPERKVIPWRYVVADATPADGKSGTRTTSPLAAAAATGRMELRTNAIVERIDVDPAMRAESPISMRTANCATVWRPTSSSSARQRSNRSACS
jgi:choline dehydrogenase-like flavoprotein